MNASSTDNISRPESLPRVVLCRLFSFAAVLALWHIPDRVAGVIYCVGALIFYIPQPAAAPCPMPTWLRGLWITVVGAIACAYFLVPTVTPPGSVVPREAKYGLLAFLTAQVIFDVYRLKQRKAQQPIA